MTEEEEQEGSSRIDLIFEALKKEGRGESSELDENFQNKKSLSFDNLNLDNLRAKKKEVEYSSVKIRTELYEQIRIVAQKQGIKQPGKFISAILKAYLDQIK
jgi:hypothetical protein